MRAFGDRKEMLSLSGKLRQRLFPYKTIYLHLHARGDEHVFHPWCCLCLMLLSQPCNASFSWRCAAGNVSVWDLAYHFYFKRLKKLFLWAPCPDVRAARSISRRQVLELLQPFPERIPRRGFLLLQFLLFQPFQHLQHLFIAMRPTHLFQFTHPLHRNAEVDRTH